MYTACECAEGSTLRRANYGGFSPSSSAAVGTPATAFQPNLSHNITALIIFDLHTKRKHVHIYILIYFCTTTKTIMYS